MSTETSFPGPNIPLMRSLLELSLVGRIGLDAQRDGEDELAYGRREAG